MAIPERETVYTTDPAARTTYTRERSGTGWFVGIIVALALLAIGYLVFSANSGPTSTSVDVNNTPAVEAPVTDPMTTTPMAPAETTPMAPAETTPMTPAESAPTTNEMAPADAAPADVAPADAAPAAPVDTAPADDAAAPVTEPAV